MGLLDRFKDKAGELVEGAKDQVTEATGFDVDKALDVAGSSVEGADRLVEAGESFAEAKDRLTG